MRWVVCWCVVLAACVEPNVVVCADGTTCPGDSVCGVSPSRCISPAQMEACEGTGDGEPCMVSGGAGECVAGVCELRFCGDGIKSPGESCDGDDIGDASCVTEGFYTTTTGLACKRDCTLDRSGCEGSCGDELKNGTELCDHDDVGTATCLTAGFYEAPGLGCSAFCTFDVSQCQGRCQDGIKNGAEVCDGAAPSETCWDLGLDAGLVGCSNACGYAFDNCGRFGFRTVPTTDLLYCNTIHASSPDDVWLAWDAGNSAHFDGTTWTKFPTGFNTNWSDIWVTGPGDAWLLDENGGQLLHWNGSTWAQNTTVPAIANDVWAFASNDVWITTGTEVHRWNGNTWSQVPGLTLDKLTAIHGSSPSNVWVVNRDGGVARWNGTMWIEAVVHPLQVNTSDVAVLAPDDVWVVGAALDASEAGTLLAHWNGQEWNVTISDGLPMSRIQAVAPNDIWASGDGFLHYDGLSWTSAGGSRGCLLALEAGRAISINSGNAAEMRGQVYGSNDPGLILGVTEPPWRLWTEPTGEAFVSLVGAGYVAQYTGGRWTRRLASTSLLRAFWGFAANDVWAIGTSGKPTHWDGNAWQESSVANTSPMFTMHATGPSDLWAGGDAGTVLHYNGSVWSSTRTIPNVPTDRIVSLSSSGPNDVWALTFNKTVYRWTGTWALVPTPVGFRPDAIHVLGPSNVIAIEVQTRQMQRWNGSTWTASTFPFIDSLPETIRSTSPTDVWLMAGTNLLHYDGTKWSRVRLPTDAPAPTGIIHGMVVRRDRVDLLFATGELRSLLRLRPWECAANETGACADRVDNDCDGKTDFIDGDCP